MAISLSTEDKLEYQFYPCASGQLQFRIKAANDAHVALTTGPNEGEPMYEVFIGGWGNSKSVIRKNRSKPDVAEADTPGILTGDDFRGFWIKWHEGSIVVGKEGDSTPFLNYHDPEPFGIGYFGVCTGWGAHGEWLLEGNKRVIKTLDELKYEFHAVPGGSVNIEIKAPSNAHIALTKVKGESSPMYEIMLGGWENSASVIRYDRKQPDKVRVKTANLLSSKEHKKFLISWLDGHIVVKSIDQFGPVLLLEWKDPNNPIGISHVGVRTGWGATGNWKLRFEEPPRPPTTAAAAAAAAASTPPKHVGSGTTGRPSAPAELVTGSVCWCDATGGTLPPTSVEGGRDADATLLYIGRAHHEGALIPGKVKPGDSVCYIAWGGEEHGKSEYQVLCGCNPRWVATSGGNIPPNAIGGGETEDGEPLYIGRVNHENTLTIGKVQPSHSVLYIPFGGAEVAFPDYEILVSE